MLPDFPKARRELYQKLRLQMDLTVQAKSPLRALGRSITQHEGTTHSYEQLTGSGIRSVTEGLEEIQVPIEVKIEEIPELVGDKLFARLAAIADEAARQVSQITFRKMDEVTREADMAVDAAGSPPTKEIWLEMFQKMEIDFDAKSGKPELTIVMHPVMAEAMKKLWIEWETDPLFIKHYNELLAQKREEWRDRESRRKLVD